MKPNFRTNIIYGLVVLVPVGILVLLVAKVAEILYAVAKPIAETLGVELAAGYGVAIGGLVTALAVLLLVSYAVGVAVRTQIGSWSFEKLETTLLKNIPGYEIINNLLKGFAEKRASYPAALVQLHGPGSAVLGFVVDTHEGGDLTVFVPMAPTITMGTVHVVAPECVTILEDAAMGLTQSISQWGIGSGKIAGIRVPRGQDASGTEPSGT